MRAGGGGIIALVVGAGVLLWASFAGAKPKARATGGPSASDIAGKKQADWANGRAQLALQHCQSPDTCDYNYVRARAAEIRNATYANDTLQAQANKTANDLEAMAQDAQDYQAAQKQAANTAYNPSDQSAFDAALSHFGG